MASLNDRLARLRRRAPQPLDPATAELDRRLKLALSAMEDWIREHPYANPNEREQAMDEACRRYDAPTFSELQEAVRTDVRTGWPYR